MFEIDKIYHIRGNSSGLKKHLQFEVDWKSQDQGTWILGELFEKRGGLTIAA
jgi:hypothetical protein